MAVNLYIKYVGTNSRSTSDIDLKVLGESIQGFDHVFRELVKLIRLDAELEVKASKVSDGSIVIKILLILGQTAHFLTPKDYLNFFQLINPALHAEMATQFSRLSDLHMTANELASRYPLDFYLLADAFVKLINLTKKQKIVPTNIDEEGNTIPNKYVPKLKRLISNRIFKKAVKPFVEGEAKRIAISSKEDFRGATVINDENFGDYLSENEQILPAWENGSAIEVTGKILSLQCSHGETMKIRIAGLPRKHQLLIAHPPDGKSTEDYLQFYRQEVSIKATIYRKSKYQKPALIIATMDLVQSAI